MLKVSHLRTQSCLIAPGYNQRCIQKRHHSDTHCKLFPCIFEKDDKLVDLGLKDQRNRIPCKYKPESNCTSWEVIRLVRRTELFGVQLDVSRAFNTVSHKAIFTVKGPGLSCMHPTGNPRDVLRKLYRIWSMEGAIRIRRVVKQVNSLPPVLQPGAGPLPKPTGDKWSPLCPTPMMLRCLQPRWELLTETTEYLAWRCLRKSAAGST
ncbi:hypothetical protein J6590_007599 [Homalodisca vitripennis]|nr:hypothetical protein J6590_007599 [Homalodisca vitripennis]